MKATRSGCCRHHPVECERPLPRAATLEDLLAPEDDAAIDDARRRPARSPRSSPRPSPRRAARGPRVSRARPPRPAPAGVPRARTGRDLPKRRSPQRWHPRRRIPPPLRRRRREGRDCTRTRRKPYSTQSAPRSLEKPLRPAEPAFSRAKLVAKGEAETRPEGSARRLLDLIRLEMKMVRALVGGDPLLVPTEHVRGSREQPEVRRRERLRLVRASEQRVRVAPGAGRVRVASPLECAPGLPCSRHRRHEPNALRRERRVGADMKHIVILGAGFAGLELASRLSESVADEVRRDPDRPKRHIRIRLLEARPHVRNVRRMKPICAAPVHRDRNAWGRVPPGADHDDRSREPAGGDRTRATTTPTSWSSRWAPTTTSRSPQGSPQGGVRVLLVRRGRADEGHAARGSTHGRS